MNNATTTTATVNIFWYYYYYYYIIIIIIIIIIIPLSHLSLSLSLSRSSLRRTRVERTREKFLRLHRVRGFVRQQSILLSFKRQKLLARFRMRLAVFRLVKISYLWNVFGHDNLPLVLRIRAVLFQRPPSLPRFAYSPPNDTPYPRRYSTRSLFAPRRNHTNRSPSTQLSYAALNNGVFPAASTSFTSIFSFSIKSLDQILVSSKHRSVNLHRTNHALSRAWTRRRPLSRRRTRILRGTGRKTRLYHGSISRHLSSSYSLVCSLKI